MPLPEAAVLDTSVLVRFFHDYGDSLQPRADLVRDAWLTDGIHLVLLDLSVYELVNVSVRRLGHTEDTARAVAGDLFRLQLPMLGVDAALASDAASIAVRTGLSGYDAAFVAAAARIGVPLLTADAEIVERTGGGGVVALGAVTSPS